MITMYYCDINNVNCKYELQLKLLLGFKCEKIRSSHAMELK